LPDSPQWIGRYEVLRRLGRGGIGVVYLGRDPDLDRHVAIKVLSDSFVEDELLQRFFREAKATASLRHENLVTVYQVGEHDHQPFIAMEYVDGTTLAEIIRQKQPRPVAQKLVFIEQICAGLHHAHRSGIVHRDIKPANVMVDSQGVIRILDFGIARVANSGMTTDGALIGSLNYMSPEQMIGRPVDYRSDIFSVGSLAYELLTYHQAFPGTMNDGLLHRLCNEDPAPFADVRPGLPEDLEAIVFRALAKRPDDRFASLDELRTAIRNSRRGVNSELQLETIVIPSHDRPKTATTRPPSSSQNRRELFERRARQNAVHRDAALAALTRGDLDAAVAACEDALTLDPDDADASQILLEIRQKKEQRDEESKARPLRKLIAKLPFSLRTLLDKSLWNERSPTVTVKRPLTDAVWFKVTAPAQLEPGTSCLLDVWAHGPRQDQLVLERARDAVSGRRILQRGVGPIAVASGAQLHVVIEVPDFGVSREVGTLLWVGEIANCSFELRVPQSASAGYHVGRAHVFLGCLKIVSIRFELEVAAHREQRPIDVTDTSEPVAPLIQRTRHQGPVDSPR
jgi:serine/threonine protein kinase